MSSTGLIPLPPHIHHSTTRLTHLQAHTLLSTFLEQADNDAAYRPDSTLTERGPQALSSGSTPNLTLSHLKRVLKGIEGRRVGGGLKVLGEEGKQEGENVNGEVVGEGEFDRGIIDDVEMEEETPKQQQDKKSKKRPLDTDLDFGLSQQTPKTKKQKQAQKIVAAPNAERTNDPTGVAVLTAPSDPDDWQDPDTFALGQNEVNANDAAWAEGGDLNEGSGQPDTIAQDDLEFQDLDAENEEKDLGSIRIEGNGEVVDTQETPIKTKKTKKSKKEKKEEKGNRKPTPIDEQQSSLAKVEKNDGKKEKKSKISNRPDLSDNLPLPSSQSSRVAPSSQITKNTKDQEVSSSALSKEERKKLKKLRHKDTKVAREEARMNAKKNV